MTVVPTPVLTSEQAIFDLHEASDADPSAYIARATRIAQNFINRNIYGDAADCDPTVDTTGIVADDAIRAGVSLILANLWTHRGDDARGATGNVVADSGALDLLLPYRIVCDESAP